MVEMISKVDLGFGEMGCIICNLLFSLKYSFVGDKNQINLPCILT